MSIRRTSRGRRATFLAATLATLIGAGGGQAFASAGCTAFNAIISPQFANPFGNSGGNVPSPFAAGDVLTIMGTGSVDNPNTTLRSQQSGRTVSASAGTVSFTVQANETSQSIDWAYAALGGGANFSFKCTPAATTGTSTPTNTDSQNIRSLQTSLSTSVATTSGQVISGAIDQGINDGFTNGTTPTFGPTGGFIGFAAVEPRSEVARRTDEAFSALAYAGNANAYGVPFYKAAPRAEREWNAWADIRGTGWKVNDTTGTGNDLRGSQVNLTAGLGRKLTSDTLVGVVVGYERFKYDVAALTGTLKGQGETIGGYFAHRFGTSLRFDAALAWSNMNYNATAGTATGSFTGSRWLATTGLTGNQKLGFFVVQPSAKLYVLWESQRAWTDSLGTLQADRKFSAGRTALGAQVARPWVTANGWTLSPYAGLYGDWRFSTDNALPTGTPVANIKNGWSARVTSGLSATALRGVNISAGGELGGLASTYKIWSGNVRAAVPF